MDIVIPKLRWAWDTIYKWFKKELDLQDKVEVVSTSYYVHRENSDGSKVKKKKLTRMRVIKRTKEVKNEL